eukprot:2732333-Amphidinium_carterae.1
MDLFISEGQSHSMLGTLNLPPGIQSRMSQSNSVTEPVGMPPLCSPIAHKHGGPCLGTRKASPRPIGHPYIALDVHCVRVIGMTMNSTEQFKDMMQHHCMQW